MPALFFVRAFDFFDLSFEEPLFERADRFSIYNRSRFRHCLFALPCAADFSARNSDRIAPFAGKDRPRLTGQYDIQTFIIWATTGICCNLTMRIRSASKNLKYLGLAGV